MASSTITETPPVQVAATRRSAVVIADPVTTGQVRIPAWVDDLQTFRRWAHSDEFPERGHVSYLQGEIWVDLSMEQLFSHNQVKTQYTMVLGWLIESAGLGYYFSDGTLLSNVGADLSTEPDGMFVSYEALKTNRVRLVKGAEEGYVELEGTPDMALEVVSPTSVRKDRRLRDLYWRAGLPELWRVDVRGDELHFEILRHTPQGYLAADLSEGWLSSAVFGREFRPVRQADPLGHPQYRLEGRPRVATGE